jgi:hypothetical protein
MWMIVCVLNCEWFLQFGCSQVCTTGLDDKSITQTRHFIESFIDSIT